MADGLVIAWLIVTSIAFVIFTIVCLIRVSDTRQQLHYPWDPTAEKRIELRRWLLFLLAAPLLAALWPVSIPTALALAFRNVWADTTPTQDEIESLIRRLEREAGMR